MYLRRLRRVFFPRTRLAIACFGCACFIHQPCDASSWISRVLGFTIAWGSVTLQGFKTLCILACMAPRLARIPRCSGPEVSRAPNCHGRISPGAERATPKPFQTLELQACGPVELSWPQYVRESQAPRTFTAKVSVLRSDQHASTRPLCEGRSVLLTHEELNVDRRAQCLKPPRVSTARFP